MTLDIPSLILGILIGVASAFANGSHERLRERQTNCPHYWGPAKSVYDEGVYWYRHCQWCKLQEHLKGPVDE